MPESVTLTDGMNSWACCRVTFRYAKQVIRFAALAASLVFQTSKAHADFSTADPLGFFTNLSSRLLKSETGLDLHWIQVYPTNQYTPAVHRLLQIAANIYDASTNRHDAFGPFPTVFAPRFTVSNNAVFITSFVEVLSTNDLSSAAPLDRDSLSATNLSSIVASDSLIFGVPLVIGARKGLPNFNEFATDASFTISRKVELVKLSPGGQTHIVGTNQYFIVDCSFASGVEYWNSYASNYSRPVEIFVYNRTSVSLTNDLGINIPLTITATGSCAITAIGSNHWGGWTNYNHKDSSFVVPLRTNITLLPPAAYAPSTGVLLSTSNAVYDTDQTLVFPRWHLAATHRVHGMVLDLNTRRIIDHVLLDDLKVATDLGSFIGTSPESLPSLVGLWATNETSGRPGVIQQILISRGIYDNTWGNWQLEMYPDSSGISTPQQIANFKAFFAPNNLAAYVDPYTGRVYQGTNTSLVTPVPLTPSKKLTIVASWQVNDPLVHAFSATLCSSLSTGRVLRILPASYTNLTGLGNLGLSNQRYKPWGYDFQEPDVYNPAIKDPLIYAPDSWQFPTNGCSTVGDLSRIHRGTPWQTIYLKSAPVSSAVWQNWLGTLDVQDAQLCLPTRDWTSTWFIASLFHINNPAQLLSVNELNPNAWLRALDGLTVLTNTSTQPFPSQTPQFDTLLISSNSPQAASVRDSIFNTRASLPTGVFRNVGDLLASQALSMASPWLNQSSPSHTRYGISDDAYEAIPSQLLSLVRPDSVGALVSSNGNWFVQFSGFDSCSYALDRSSDLLSWITVSTNYPTNGVFSFPVSSTGNQFFRSRLLP